MKILKDYIHPKKHKKTHKSQHQTHFIGHLQTNKIKEVIKYLGCIQSVDIIELAEKLQNRLEFENKSIDIFIHNGRKALENPTDRSLTNQHPTDLPTQKKIKKSPPHGNFLANAVGTFCFCQTHKLTLRQNKKSQSQRFVKPGQLPQPSPYFR